jgi:hypothetical protein
VPKPEQLTRYRFGRSFAPREGHAMTSATKKPPTRVVSDPQELEHQIRQCAYELYEESGRKAAIARWKKENAS